MSNGNVVIEVNKATTKADWVLVASVEAGAPKAYLYQTDDSGNPTDLIENIELIFPSESDDGNIFKATIPVISEDGCGEFTYKRNNPINFTNNPQSPTTPPGLSCLSLIALGNGKETLKLAFKCVLGEEANLTFNVKSDAGDHFISHDPGISIVRR